MSSLAFFSGVTKTTLASLVKKPLALFFAGALAVGTVGAYAVYGERDTLGDTIVAERGVVVREVSVTGRIKAVSEANLAFETSGKIATIPFSVGDQVFAGAVLATLENADISASLRQAEASVIIEEAKLRELESGSRPEDIAIAEARMKSAETAMEDAETALADKFPDAFTKAEDAVRNKIDYLFSNPASQTPQFNILSFSDTQLKSDIEWQRVLIETSIFPKLTAQKTAQSEEVLEKARTIRSLLAPLVDFTNDVSIVVNSPNTFRVVNGVGQAVPDTWKADVLSARTNINTAISTIITAEEKVRSARGALALAQEELLLKKAGTVPEQILAQKARVESARASADEVRARLAKTIIRAPFAGVLSKNSLEKGETVSANVSVLSVISLTALEVEAFVPEADIARIQEGDTGRATLDAYGSDEFFPVVITDIEPAETVVDGVATYRTTIQFTQQDERIRPGMTANIDIIAERRGDVIVLPYRALVTENGFRSVFIVEDGVAREVEVKVGLRGSDGLVEIVSGVHEGDHVLMSPRL